jgi:hypothetical protein
VPVSHAYERWSSDINTRFTLSREQGAGSRPGLRIFFIIAATGMQLGRCAEELIIVVVIVNAADAASSESHSFIWFIVVAAAAAASTALPEYVAERRAGDIERYSQQ